MLIFSNADPDKTLINFYHQRITMNHNEILKEIELALINRFPSLRNDRIHLSVKLMGDDRKELFYQFPKKFEEENRDEAIRIIVRKGKQYGIPSFD